MGVMVENLAREYDISRESQDVWALSSQHRAHEAIDSGRFRDEIALVITKRNDVARTVDIDERPRVDANAEGLASPQPTFGRLRSVATGNASDINDDTTAVMMVSEAKTLELGSPILVQIHTFASVGVDPVLMGIAPMRATRHCLEWAN